MTSGTRPRRTVPAGYPVLASKITAPAVPGWVISRPRLTERIAAGAALPLTVVTGPPGAGKTMALASWAAAGTVPGRVAWVALDEFDNRPGAFWSCVVEALRQAGVAVPGGQPALSRDGAIDHGFLLRLASVLAGQDPPVVLVLDDLHLITAPGPVAELAAVLRYARPGLHLIAAARADPLLPLHRYRVTGELTEIRAAEMSFTVPEAAQLMGQHGITLPGQMLELITRRVEGWAAGLRLAALSLDGHPDPALFIKNLVAEDNVVASYLVAEVLDAQPAATRDLMLRTSIVNEVNADLACLAAARGALAQGRASAAMDLLRRARHGWSPPPWLDHLLTVTESHAHTTAGDIPAALTAAHRAGSALDACTARARAWLAAGNIQAAQRALAGAVGDPSDIAIQLQANLTDALISHRSGARARARRSLERALRLGGPEGYRLPFIQDWAWIRSALRYDSYLASACHRLVAPGQPSHGDQAAQLADTNPPALVITEQLSAREREVLQRASAMHSTAEIASELYVSVNTIKTHLRNIYRKLGAERRAEAVRRARQLELI